MTEVEETQHVAKCVKSQEYIMSYVMCLWRFPPLHIILSIGKVYFDVALLLLPPHLSLDVVMASHSDCDVTWLVGNTQDAV